MILGLVTIKPYKKLENQYLGTQFFALGIPLFPINGVFIVDDLTGSGIETGINRKHLVKIYSVALLLILFFLLIIPDLIKIYFLIKTAIFFLSIAATIYLLSRYDRMTEDEIEARLFFGKITGINALPSYMNSKSAMVLRNKFIIVLKNQIKTKEHWKEILKKKLYSEKDIPLLYVISAFEYQTNPNSENKKILNEFKSKTELANNKHG